MAMRDADLPSPLPMMPIEQRMDESEGAELRSHMQRQHGRHVHNLHQLEAGYEDLLLTGEDEDALAPRLEYDRFTPGLRRWIQS